MSQDTIDRWNAIPLERQKRSRTPSDKDDDTDDDVSLVSRTPSPEPVDLNEYDKYHRGYEREIITVETKLKETNIGHKMLQKMGWKEGEGLGISGQGRPDPIPFKLKSDLTGLGKTTQDVRMIALTVAQRRDLDSERQSRETEAQKRAREDKVAKKEAIKSEITTTLRSFYCELCDKQYKSVTQYDEHIRSYAHTHKQRFKEMEARQRPKDNSKVREKERKREEKELKRLAAASGVKLAATPATSVPNAAPVAATAVAAPTGVSQGGGCSSAFKTADSNSGGFKKSGWAAVASTAPTSGGDSSPNPSGSGKSAWGPAEPSTSNTGFRKVGWTSISAASAPADRPPPPRSPPPPPPADAGADIPSIGLPPAPSHGGKLPTFTRGGFTNLDTTSERITTSELPSTPRGPSETENGVSRMQWKTSSWAPATIASNVPVSPSPPVETAIPLPPHTTPPPPPPDNPPPLPGDRPFEYGNRSLNAIPGRRFDGSGNTYDARDRQAGPWAMDVDDIERDDRQGHPGWQSREANYLARGYGRDAGQPGYAYGAGGRDRGYQNSRGHGYGGGRGYRAGNGRR